MSIDTTSHHRKKMAWYRLSTEYESWNCEEPSRQPRESPCDAGLGNDFLNKRAKA